MLRAGWRWTHWLALIALGITLPLVLTLVGTIWWQSKAMAELRLKEPKAYLAKLKASGSSNYSAELRALDPEAYAMEEKAKVEKIASLKKAFGTEKDDTKKLALAKQVRALDPNDFQMELRVNEIEYRLKLPELMAQTPHKFLEMKNSSWRAGGFGRVMIASFTIKNPLPFDVRDVGVACEVFGASGTRIGLVGKVVYQTVKAGRQTRVDDLSMGIIDGQSSSANCNIVSASKA